MQIITYSLRGTGESSDRYFQDVSAFADEVLEAGAHAGASTLEGFQSFIARTGREPVRTRGEYLYEWLTLGVLWQVYGAAALRLPPAPQQALERLVRWRERDPRAKPLADRLRGILGNRYLSSRPSGRTALPLTIAHIERLGRWLAATGVYAEICTRLLNWLDFLVCQNPEDSAEHLATALHFAAWFDRRSVEALGQYTPNVQRFIAQATSRYRWREDVVFCLRPRVEYHLNMVGTEILNRTLRERFLDTKRKIVVVPPCMRFQTASRCQARPSAFGEHCMHCTPQCPVHQVTRLGEKHGFDVFILPDELAVFSSGGGQTGRGTVGIIGVSCVLTNAPGGWEMLRLDVPAQGLPLDYCGCRFHWDKQGFPTSINLHQLLRLLGIPAPKSSAASLPGGLA